MTGVFGCVVLGGNGMKVEEEIELRYKAGEKGMLLRGRRRLTRRRKGSGMLVGKVQVI